MKRREFNALLIQSAALGAFLPRVLSAEETVSAKISPEKWRLGISISGNSEYSQTEIDAIRAAGFDCIEASCGRLESDEHVIQAFTKLKAQCEQAELDVWSVHIPFSQTQDVAQRDETKRRNMLEVSSKFLKWGNELLDAHTFVIHPSSEPIPDAERPAAFSQCVKSLKVLHEEAKAKHSVLCMENIPRTCLANTSKEAMEILTAVAPDMKMCYDANHLLQETPEHFVDGIEKGRIYTTHISDYDWIDERHWIPFEGKTDWKLVVDALVRQGFQGPFLYECRRYKDGRTASFEEMAAVWKRILSEYQNYVK